MNFKLWLEQNQNIQDIVQAYLESPIGKQYKNNDCKSVTRAFINWAEKNNIEAKAVHLAPPSKEFVKNNPQFKGKSGEGDSHIMPVVKGYAIDFTARQFGINRPYENPLITPIDQLKTVYGQFGYYTDTPDWFAGGKSSLIKPFKNLSTMPKEFNDETM